MVATVSSKPALTPSQSSRKFNTSFLKDVIKKKNMSMCSLAHTTGIPKTTMSRFLNGHTQKPTFQLVYDISKCLNVDISHLFEHDKGILSVEDENQARKATGTLAVKIPVIEWHEINDWTAGKLGSLDLINKRWIGTAKAISPKSFALRSSAVMEPHVPGNSVIVVNPQGQIADQKWVLFTASKQIDPIIHKVIAYGPDFYLKPLIEEHGVKTMVRLTSDTPIIGILEEAVTFL